QLLVVGHVLRVHRVTMPACLRGRGLGTTCFGVAFCAESGEGHAGNHNERVSASPAWHRIDTVQRCPERGEPPRQGEERGGRRGSPQALTGGVSARRL